MKTITLEKVVPVPGILGAFLGFVEAHRTNEMPNNEILEATVEQRPTEKQDPWT